MDTMLLHFSFGVAIMPLWYR